MVRIFLAPLALGVVLLGQSNAAVSLASGAYSEDFNAPLDSNAWTFSTQTVSGTTTAQVAVTSYVDGGRTMVTGTGDGDGLVSTRIAPAPSGITYPLPVVTTPGSYATYGFSGSWLVNVGDQRDGAGATIGNGNLAAARTATVSFDNVAAHTTIHSLSFLLGVGDSIDPSEGVFEVLVDGNVVFRRDFGSGGSIESAISEYGNVGDPSTIDALVTGGNLKGDGFYREYWTAGADDSSDRLAEPWTRESAYRIELNDIAHTSDTLDIQFVWRGVNGNWTDEFIAIDNLYVSVPEPGKAALMLGGFAFLFFRRRKA